ncbi:hypothetical protein EV44_g3924 [Erysiphe necator]|uniref:Uncharacterized protein n=1 Tax=Uncinula necator TaxID=52586 RepID=A0A0B1P5T2_UNCNE|nr:hypothetical protein EV44_g3924 [Erysiphe necator]
MLGTTHEKRLMVDILAIRQSYERREIADILWIKGNRNPADAMTKEKACNALQQMVDTNRLDLELDGWVESIMHFTRETDGKTINHIEPFQTQLRPVILPTPTLQPLQPVAQQASQPLHTTVITRKETSWPSWDGSQES